MFSIVFSDLIPIEMENLDYEDLLESSLQRPVKPRLPPSSLSNNKYDQPLVNSNTTTHIFNQNSHSHTTTKGPEGKQLSLFIMNAIRPDQMLQEIEENTTLSKIAPSNFKMSLIYYFKIILFLKLLVTFHA